MGYARHLPLIMRKDLSKFVTGMNYKPHSTKRPKKRTNDDVTEPEIQPKEKKQKKQTEQPNRAIKQKPRIPLK